MDQKEGQHEAHKDHKAHKALPQELEVIGRAIVNSALKVHKALGPGLLESTYEHCLVHELGMRGLSCQRQ